MLKIFIIIAIIVLLPFFFYGAIQREFQSRIFSFESVAARPSALVLGASVKSRKPNSALQERLDMATLLYESGKVKKLVLSGDNRTIEYNEPQAMKDYLIEKGIPEHDLVLDYAGRRTYDSCYRARDIFHLDSVIIVTQDFHLPRALYLCNTLGIDAIGVAADTQYSIRWFGWYLREIPATLQAWIDINFRKPIPVLGNPEKVF